MRAAVVGALAVATAGVLVMFSSGPAVAQEGPTATIEIVFTYPDDPHQLILYRARDADAGQVEVRRETNVRGQSWTVDVEPGCYAVRITRTGGPPGGWLNPISDQPAFCLEAGQRVSHETGAIPPQTARRAIINGTVLDPAGVPVSGARVDFFNPPAGLARNEIRRLDHEAADHRNGYRFGIVTGADGRYSNVSFFSECYVQTFTAPDGYTWAGGDRYLNRSACSSEDVTLTAFPGGAPSPADAWLEIEVPPEYGARELIVEVDDGDRFWARAAVPYQARMRVEAGCYVVSFDIGDGSTIWTEATSSIQDVPVCVAGGATASVSPTGGLRTVDYDLDDAFLDGIFLDRTGGGTPRYLPGVQVDVFYPVDWISDDELQNVDHTQADYRGDYYRTAVSDENGFYNVPIFGRCFVSTMIAPEGYEFVDTAGRYLQDTTCQELDGRFWNLRRTADPDTEFGGRIVTESGDPVEGISVDVFTPIDGVSDDELPGVDHTTTDYRRDYTQTAVTGADGSFSFRGEARCWVLTYIGTDQVRFPTGRYYRQTLCPGDTPTVVVPDADVEPATIGGTVTGGPAVVADLFEANPDGTRGRWLTDTDSVDGSYSFDVPAGCYITVLIAPDGFTFAASGSRWQQLPACVDAGGDVTNPPATLIAG